MLPTPTRSSSCYQGRLEVAHATEASPRVFVHSHCVSLHDFQACFKSFTMSCYKGRRFPLDEHCPNGLCLGGGGGADGGGRRCAMTLCQFDSHALARVREDRSFQQRHPRWKPFASRLTSVPVSFCLRDSSEDVTNFLCFWQVAWVSSTYAALGHRIVLHVILGLSSDEASAAQAVSRYGGSLM